MDILLTSEQLIPFSFGRQKLNLQKTNIHFQNLLAKFLQGFAQVVTVFVVLILSIPSHIKIWVSNITIMQVLRETKFYSLDGSLSAQLKIYQAARNCLKVKNYEGYCTLNIHIKTVPKISLWEYLEESERMERKTYQNYPKN